MVETGEARKAFDKAIALDQADPLPRLGLGLAMIRQGDLEEGRRELEVAITLDNASGWLPLPFGEIRVARRAYRSGENEYLLNGQRVRLREISELLAQSGLAERTYTIIGQGLVDAALALKPEDRIMVMAPIVRGRKGEYKKDLEKLARQGFLRARIDGIGTLSNRYE